MQRFLFYNLFEANDDALRTLLEQGKQFGGKQTVWKQFGSTYVKVTLAKWHRSETKMYVSANGILNRIPSAYVLERKKWHKRKPYRVLFLWQFLFVFISLIFSVIRGRSKTKIFGFRS